MGRDCQSGICLLLDAAGPETVFGLVGEGGWIKFMSSPEEPFIEGCQPCVERLLQDAGLRLQDLSGILYASGPGSTLGLRLAAMFARSLLMLPHLQHWKCAQYNNLELAAVSLVDEGEALPVQAIAPWRRDRIHRVLVKGLSPLDILPDSLHPDELDPATAWLFPLGNRPRNLPPLEKVRPYPTADIPRLLTKYPDLLKFCPEPTPFAAETPEFVRWSSKRHTAP